MVNCTACIPLSSYRYFHICYTMQDRALHFVKVPYVPYLFCLSMCYSPMPRGASCVGMAARHVGALYRRLCGLVWALWRIQFLFAWRVMVCMFLRCHVHCMALHGVWLRVVWCSLNMVISLYTF